MKRDDGCEGGGQCADGSEENLSILDLLGRFYNVPQRPHEARQDHDRKYRGHCRRKPVFPHRGLLRIISQSVPVIVHFPSVIVFGDL